MNIEELGTNVLKVLKKHRTKYRSFNLEDDKLSIGIEGKKSDHEDLLRDLRKLSIYPSSITYGRWTFYIK